MPEITEFKKEVLEQNKPFWKTKEFWIEVTKVIAQAGVAFGAAYIANKGNNNGR